MSGSWRVRTPDRAGVLEAERRGRDRADKPEYKVKLSAALCFSNRVQRIEYYHNSSWLEHGGSPEKAVEDRLGLRHRQVPAGQQQVQKGESKITFQDVQDCLILVRNSFSTQTSYENQTKKAITNKFVQEAMTEFLQASGDILHREPRDAARRSPSRCSSTSAAARRRKSAPEHQEKAHRQIDIANRVQKFVDCRTQGRLAPRDLHRGGRLRSGRVQALARRGVSGHHARARQDPELPQGGLCAHFQERRHHRPDEGAGLRRGGAAASTSRTWPLTSSNLRWNKVVICTDADVDGFQIRTLILTMLYRLAPTLIARAMSTSPSRPCTRSPEQGKTWFAYTEPEKADILKKLGGAKVTIKRSKGLGENDPEMMWLTTMNPETRRSSRSCRRMWSGRRRCSTCCWAITCRRKDTSRKRRKYLISDRSGRYRRPAIHRSMACAGPRLVLAEGPNPQTFLGTDPKDICFR